MRHHPGDGFLQRRLDLLCRLKGPARELIVNVARDNGEGGGSIPREQRQDVPQDLIYYSSGRVRADLCKHLREAK